MGFFDRFRKAPTASPELAPSQQTPVLVTRCLDQLALLYPEGWRVAEIRARLENDGTSMFIDTIDIAPLESTEPLPAFPDDPAMRTALLATALQQVCTSVGLRGNHAFSTHIAGHAIRILDKTFEGSGEPLYSPAFFRALAPAIRGGQQGFSDWQDQFRHKFAETSAGGLRWEREAGQLSLTNAAGETSSVEADVLGSYAPAEQTWRWAWANPGLANAEQATLRRVRDATNLALLREPAFDWA